MRGNSYSSRVWKGGLVLNLITRKERNIDEEKYYF
jgi:hypothetical protein